ncbi:MAG: rod-binding protein [Lachnospiraceae bacterium]|nr:rod-binding protein [Lachnospiraceae bacterium]
MSIEIGSNYFYQQQLRSTAAKSSADKLSGKLSGLSASEATDEELMEACKSFEQYLVEQVMKSTKEAMIPKSEEDDNQYMKYFGENLYQEYAKLVTENANLGIAKMLYESVKRNT